MSTAVAVQHVKTKIQPFDLAPGTPGKLARLAQRADVSSSLYLQLLVTMAHDAIVLGRPLQNEAFAPRLRELAAQAEHPERGPRTSFRLDDDDMHAIRKLRDVLQLPRRDLVVEYTIQAMWDLVPPDGDGSKKESPSDRKRKLARFHNVDPSASVATDGGRLLFFTPASQLRLRGLEVPLKPKKR